MEAIEALVTFDWKQKSEKVLEFWELLFIAYF